MLSTEKLSRNIRFRAGLECQNTLIHQKTCKTKTKHCFHCRFKPSTIPVMCSHRGGGGHLQQWLWAQNVIHLYLTSNRVESSSSSFSSFKGAISTRSAGVVMMSYLRVFLIFFADLHIFMTRHVISKTVNTQMKIEMFLMVGRSLKIVEIRDPTSESVSLTLCDECSSWGSNVELSGVAEDGRVCGSPFTSCAMTTRAIAKVYSHILFPCLNCLLNVLYI